MSFRDEYKNEIIRISPDEAASERIREGVMKQLSKQPKKKPIPFGRIAVIGASAAACLVIGFTALTMSQNSKYFSGNATAPNAAGNEAMASDKNNIWDNADNMQTATEPGSVNNNEDNAGSIGIGSIGDGTAAERIFIRFDENGFTLSGSEKHYSLPNVSSGSDAVNAVPPDPEAPSPSAPAAEPAEYTEVFTAGGEKFLVKYEGNKVVLFNEDMDMMGIYVSDG